ncbi:hypothetical protein [Nostoc sp.]|uniref:hypothetical protein n=1 Tax=Nostoc sp. TaxID=1180 RepID=UPI002FF89FF6
MNSNQKIKDFLHREIFDLHENQIDTFLNDYSHDAVIQCLLDTLKSPSSFEYGFERSWKLGRILRSISNRYSVDTHLLSLLTTCTLAQKKSFINFLSGYWDNGNSNIEMVLKIIEDIESVIANPNELVWDREAIAFGLEAVTLGYLNNNELFHINKDFDNKLIKIFKVFKEYMSNFPSEYPAKQLLSENFD